MLRLSGGTYFLLLRRALDFQEHSIGLFRRFDDALASWEPGARISPIFALERASPPDLGKTPKGFIIFLGPLSPGEIPSAPTPHSFLTLGLYNFVFFAVDADQRKAVHEIIDAHSTPWEEWELRYSSLSSITTFSGTEAAYRIARKHLQPLRNQPKALRESAREYVALFATSLGRAQLFAPQFTGDLSRFDENFRQALSEPGVDTTTRQRLLVLTNAALSRQSSQTFAGTSPILETECHYWTHSLLGIGVASLAILRVRSFLEDILSRSRIIERLVCLKSVPPHATHLESLSATNPFWDQDHLFVYPSQASLPSPDIPPENDVLPLITCFSGRDGFRSTEVSLSAPLDVISACNTTEWTPLTLTHEFSHRVVDGILGQLLPNPDTSKELEEAIVLLRTRSYPDLFMQLRTLLCFSLWRIDERAERVISSEDLGIIIKSQWATLSEVLTHCFDFLYFYRRDSRVYVRAVWASWGVIPNIHLRISQYLLRCLCALHTQNLARENGISVTINQLRIHLSSLAIDFPDAAYVGYALEELHSKEEYYKTGLSERELLVKLVRFFLYASRIEQMLSVDSIIGSGDRDGYSLNPLEFTPESIENPLRFIEAYSKDKTPDQGRSVWLLHQLAFGASRR